MSISFLLTNLLSCALTPPCNGLLLLVAGCLLWRRRPRLAYGLLLTGTLALWLLATPIVARWLIVPLEGEVVRAADVSAAQAIVVLGGGRYRDAPEYGGDTIDEKSLLRVRYAARLQRATGLPLLVTGGMPDGGTRSEGEIMRDVLREEFGVPVRWVEMRSNTTAENTRYSAELLKADGISRVLVVTHAAHLPRAIAAFARVGIDARPAGTFFHGTERELTTFDFLPLNYRDSSYAIHEWIGLLWYRLRG